MNRQPIRFGSVVAILLGSILAAGCAPARQDQPATVPSANPTAPAESASDAPYALPRSEPVRLEVPAIGVRAPVVRVGLTSTGTLEVPPLDRPGETGWYTRGPTPGELGPALIIGHVDSKSGPAVFFRLRELKPGDLIRVVRADGSVATFRTTELEQVPKTAFPTERVYGNIDHAGLRLVTCGGTFDRSQGSYRDNVIVYATLVEQ